MRTRRRVASPVTATADFLAPSWGTAPAVPHALQRIRETDGRWSGRHLPALRHGIDRDATGSASPQRTPTVTMPPSGAHSGLKSDVTAPPPDGCYSSGAM